MKKSAHFALEFITRSLTDDQVLDLIFDVGSINTPHVACCRVHLFMVFRLRSLFGVRMGVAPLAPLFFLVAPAVVFETTVCAHDAEGIELTPASVPTAVVRSARCETLSDEVKELFAHHRRPLGINLMLRAFTPPVIPVREASDQRAVRHQLLDGAVAELTAAWPEIPFLEKFTPNSLERGASDNPVRGAIPELDCGRIGDEHHVPTTRSRQLTCTEYAVRALVHTLRAPRGAAVRPPSSLAVVGDATTDNNRLLLRELGRAVCIHLQHQGVE